MSKREGGEGCDCSSGQSLCTSEPCESLAGAVVAIGLEKMVRPRDLSTPWQ